MVEAAVRGSGRKDKGYTNITVTEDVLVKIHNTAFSLPVSDILVQNLHNGLFEVFVIGSQKERSKILGAVIPKKLGGIRRRNLF